MFFNIFAKLIHVYLLFLKNKLEQTAADLASSKGHKGIVGYLAETDLTNHLLALSVKDKDKNGVKSEVEVDDDDDDATHSHSLKGSLVAVRRSAHASALIQDAFRDRSFNQRQQQATKAKTDELAFASSSSSLQKNEFLKIRERVVKIEAYFRGHKVHKHYKKVVWSVGIVEKAILRWRPKSRGLRGFRPELRARNRNMIS
ncbi:unnamed protein product [Lactuca virosa]|uniref:Calmodulin-binding domain-containing protein n=1 Tax=Lactuca virosa TaxID=75947 RepID=A0AAU9MV18_9ASTR|nr:unnamed protein product [Lactuca virosa]